MKKNNIKKKLCALSLAGVMTFTAGCSNSKTNKDLDSQNQTSTSCEQVDTTPPTVEIEEKQITEEEQVNSQLTSLIAAMNIPNKFEVSISEKNILNIYDYAEAELDYDSLNELFKFYYENFPQSKILYSPHGINNIDFSKVNIKNNLGIYILDDNDDLENVKIAAQNFTIFQLNIFTLQENAVTELLSLLELVSAKNANITLYLNDEEEKTIETLFANIDSSWHFNSFYAKTNCDISQYIKNINASLITITCGNKNSETKNIEVVNGVESLFIRYDHSEKEEAISLNFGDLPASLILLRISHYDKVETINIDSINNCNLSVVVDNFESLESALNSGLLDYHVNILIGDYYLISECDKISLFHNYSLLTTFDLANVDKREIINAINENEERINSITRTRIK